MSSFLVTSTQYPYYGGAATNSYALIKYLRSIGHKVTGIFFFDEKSGSADPDQIGDVFQGDKRPNSAVNRQLVNTVISSLGGKAPEIILAKNYLAPSLSHEFFPNVPLVYLVSGSWHLTQFANQGISAQEFFRKPPSIPTNKTEEKSILLSDAVVPNSKLSEKVLTKIYPQHSHKIKSPLDTSSILNNTESLTSPVKSFSERDIDILFISSKLDRKIKNFDFARSIFSSRELNKFKKVVVGAGSFQEKHIKYTGELKHPEVIQLLQNTKLLICTSFFDSSPNVVREALQMKCNVLVSKNTGWHEHFPNEFVCDDVTSENEWVKKIIPLLQKNMDFHFRSLSLSEEIDNYMKNILLTLKKSATSYKDRFSGSPMSDILSFDEFYKSLKDYLGGKNQEILQRIPKTAALLRINRHSKLSRQEFVQKFGIKI